MASKEVHISGRTESRTVTGWSSSPSPTRLRTRNFSSNMGRTTGSGTTASSPPRSRPKQRPSYDICYTPEQRRTAPRDGRIHWAGKHWRGGTSKAPRTPTAHGSLPWSPGPPWMDTPRTPAKTGTGLAAPSPAQPPLLSHHPRTQPGSRHRPMALPTALPPPSVTTPRLRTRGKLDPHRAEEGTPLITTQREQPHRYPGLGRPPLLDHKQDAPAGLGGHPGYSPDARYPPRHGCG